MRALHELSKSPSRDASAPYLDKANLVCVEIYARLVNRFLNIAAMAKVYLGVYSLSEIGRQGAPATFNPVADKRRNPHCSGDTIGQYASMVAGLTSMALRLASRAEADVPHVELLESLLDPTWATGETLAAALRYRDALLAFEPTPDEASGTHATAHSTCFLLCQ